MSCLEVRLAAIADKFDSIGDEGKQWLKAEIRKLLQDRTDWGWMEQHKASVRPTSDGQWEVTVAFGREKQPQPDVIKIRARILSMAISAAVAAHKAARGQHRYSK